MDDATVRVEGHLDVPPEHRESVADTLADHVALTRAEPGYLDFDRAPDPNVAGRYRVSEAFVDRAAFDAHQARGAASPWAAASAGATRHFTITEGGA